MNLYQKIKQISSLLQLIKTDKQMSGVLQDLFTPQELETVAERISLMTLLKQKLSQRDVASQLWISITTVNRGARMLKYGSGEIQQFLS